MEINQAIKKAQIIQVKTKIGSAVKITKKEALRYVSFCESQDYDYQPEITEIFDGKLLIVLN